MCCVPLSVPAANHVFYVLYPHFEYGMEYYMEYGMEYGMKCGMKCGMEYGRG